MNWKHLGGVVLVIAVLALAIGAAAYTGIGPAPGGGDSNAQLTDFPTATPSDGSSSEATAESTSAGTTEPFTLTVDSVEDCGLTCRDVTVTLHNQQDEPASGVTVFVRIFAGQDNTDTADRIWEGKEEVGTLEAAGSHTATKRVELSLQEAQQVDQRDGWITIVTTVETDERTVTFRESQQVT